MQNMSSLDSPFIGGEMGQVILDRATSQGKSLNSTKENSDFWWF